LFSTQKKKLTTAIAKWELLLCSRTSYSLNVVLHFDPFWNLYAKNQKN